MDTILATLAPATPGNYHYQFVLSPELIKDLDLSLDDTYIISFETTKAVNTTSGTMMAIFQMKHMLKNVRSYCREVSNSKNTNYNNLPFPPEQINSLIEQVPHSLYISAQKMKMSCR
ncbi:hypothetical protein [Chitinophaga pinensis]|uniref:Uncharacterized protein n=1 Tax=Chitinophaga pinensis TaxID=79329 RepID=A0A5C6LPJ7_9BACT|nr:hypothetical protein [Chitinophaga pinensis]TWV97358.1 hypothetical protein FEF09_22110 [Chitinophaga pinensis]